MQLKLAIEDVPDTGLPRIYSPELCQPKCSAAAGNPSGPGLYPLLEVPGQGKTLAKIERALAALGS